MSRIFLLTRDLRLTQLMLLVSCIVRVSRVQGNRRKNSVTAEDTRQSREDGRIHVSAAFELTTDPSRPVTRSHRVSDNWP